MLWRKNEENYVNAHSMEMSQAKVKVKARGRYFVYILWDVDRMSPSGVVPWRRRKCLRLSLLSRKDTINIAPLCTSEYLHNVEGLLGAQSYCCLHKTISVYFLIQSPYRFRTEFRYFQACSLTYICLPSWLVYYSKVVGLCLNTALPAYCGLRWIVE